MNENDYLYADARIRVKELGLLPTAELDRLVQAGSYADAVSSLNARGYGIEGTDFGPALSKRLEETLGLLFEILPDKSILNALFIKNDFHNLKCGVKSAVTGADASGLLITPSVYPASDTFKNASEHKWQELPEELSAVAEEAYGILSVSGSAFLSDSFIDGACLRSVLKYADQSGSDLLREYARESVAAADIRILYRCSKAGRQPDNIGDLTVDIPGFSSAEGAERAYKSPESFIEWLSGTPFARYAEALKDSDAAFEKLCDDSLMRICERGKRTSFGPDPVIAYYVAVCAEVKTVRIILSCKLNEIPADVISRRMRELYV